jgi:hypothetical protein
MLVTCIFSSSVWLRSSVLALLCEAVEVRLQKQPQAVLPSSRGAPAESVNCPRLT